MVNGLVQIVKVNFYPSKKSVINNISLKEEIPSYFQPNYKEWFIDIRKGENQKYCNFHLGICIITFVPCCKSYLKIENKCLTVKLFQIILIKS